MMFYVSSTMFQNVLKVFHDVLLCFTTLVSHATIGIAALSPIAASATAQPPIASGIGDNTAETSNNAKK